MDDHSLPPRVAAALDELAGGARAAFGENLIALVLFGSAAEGRLRATSDVNLAVVLSRFDAAQAAALREPLRTAKAVADVNALFLLESELPAAAEAFADKLADIHRRRRVLFGRDVFAELRIPRDAEIRRLGQVLLNLSLRLRNAYVLRGLREEQLALALADAAGPLRSAAAALLELEGQGGLPPKESLEKAAPEGLRDLLPALSTARETRSLPPGQAGPLVLRAIELADALRARSARLAP